VVFEPLETCYVSQRRVKNNGAFGSRYCLKGKMKPRKKPKQSKARTESIAGFDRMVKAVKKVEKKRPGWKRSEFKYGKNRKIDKANDV